MISSAFFHYLKFVLGIEVAHTQTTTEEENRLLFYAKGCKTAVEIGVFEGANTVKIAQSISPDGRLYGVDPFFTGRLGICYGKLIAKFSFKKKKVDHKIILIEKLSEHAADDLPGKVDFMFIDGDHTYNGLSIDWNLVVKSKLKVGGIVCLHDTTVPVEEPHRMHGSVDFYNEVIQGDTAFQHLETVYSMNILKRMF